MEPETHAKFHRFSDEDSYASQSNEVHIPVPMGEVQDLQQPQPDLQPPYYSIDPNSYHVTVPQPNYSLGYDAQPSPQDAGAYGGAPQQFVDEAYQTYQMGGVPPPSSLLRDKAQEFGQNVMDNVGAKISDYKASVKEAILSREYEVSIKAWIARSWEIYKQCWWGYSLVTLLSMLLYAIPIVRWFACLFTVPMQAGLFIATCNSLRTGTNVRFGHMWHGLLFFIPLTILMILQWLAISVGFFLCLIPGLFLMVTLSFSAWIYLEYYCDGISVIDSMALSVKVTMKRFFLIAWFLIVLWLIVLAGALLLGIGTLVAIPISVICSALAFQELFGLNNSKQLDNTCIVGM